jgi:hypothetical protein
MSLSRQALVQGAQQAWSSIFSFLFMFLFSRSGHPSVFFHFYHKRT